MLANQSPLLSSNTSTMLPTLNLSWWFSMADMSLVGRYGCSYSSPYSLAPCHDLAVTTRGLPMNFFMFSLAVCAAIPHPLPLVSLALRSQYFANFPDWELRLAPLNPPSLWPLNMIECLWSCAMYDGARFLFCPAASAASCIISSGMDDFFFNLFTLALAVIILALSASVGVFGLTFLPEVDASDLSRASSLILPGPLSSFPNGTFLASGSLSLSAKSRF